MLHLEQTLHAFVQQLQHFTTSRRLVFLYFTILCLIFQNVKCINYRGLPLSKVEYPDILRLFIYLTAYNKIPKFLPNRGLNNLYIFCILLYLK